ncbi:hypothetical protein K438DRAFT_740363 [Mycena galopus ATCC 62051]|nr:hypothetical protein K438DRAFT_740363 [Mycena galopus ATCC 62051]
MARPQLIFMLHRLKYVLWSTKSAILSELAGRISEVDARASLLSYRAGRVRIISNYHVLALLESPNSMVRAWTCELVGRLASHESTASDILELKPCVPLVSSLREDNVEVVRAAMFALSHIA